MEEYLKSVERLQKKMEQFKQLQQEVSTLRAVSEKLKGE